jgi:AcrR family transcriptional regulator
MKISTMRRPSDAATKTQPPARPRAFPEAAVSDGRLARSARTRERLAEAWLALLEAGELRPSAAAVAAAAGLSTRVVFHHFADLDALFSIVADLQTARVLRDAKPDLKTEGAFAARLDAFVARRVGILERITPVRRAAALQEPFSKEVARRLAWSRREGREEVLRAFAPELAGLRPAARAEVIEGLASVTSWTGWQSLRHDAGLSLRRASAVVRRTVVALLRQED